MVIILRNDDGSVKPGLQFAETEDERYERSDCNQYGEHHTTGIIAGIWILYFRAR